MISCVYPYSVVDKLTPKQVKDDIAFLGKKFRKKYPKGYLFYQVDYSQHQEDGSPGAGIHFHLIGRCGRYSSKAKLPRFRPFMTGAWGSRIGSDEAHLIKVQKLREEHDSHAACSYLLRGEKFEDHKRVTEFLEPMRYYGCYGQENVVYASPKQYKILREDFQEVRKHVAFDTHEDSKRSSDDYLCDHESKVMNAGSGLHIISDPDLHKKLRRVIARQKKSKGGK